jgi:hypothetical protein
MSIVRRGERIEKVPARSGWMVGLPDTTSKSPIRHPTLPTAAPFPRFNPIPQKTPVNYPAASPRRISFIPATYPARTIARAIAAIQTHHPGSLSNRLTISSICRSPVSSCRQSALFAGRVSIPLKIRRSQPRRRCTRFGVLRRNQFSEIRPPLSIASTILPATAEAGTL